MRTYLGSLVLILTLFAGSGTVFAIGGDMGASTEPQTDGSETYPYLIEDMTDFQTFSGDSNYWASGIHTKLMVNINLSGSTQTMAVIAPDTDNTNYPWDFDGDPFMAVFDGNNHTISNITINVTEADYLGLFGKVSSSTAEIKNLIIENVSITCGNFSEYIGGLCGEISDGNFSNCHITGSVTGGDESRFIGGLCGNISSANISNCSAAGAVHGAYKSMSIGGLCGANGHGTIDQCYAIGQVDAGDESQFMGGLCGTNAYGTISDCFATGTVTGGYASWYLGGLSGDNLTTIVRCYSTGSVTGGDHATFLGGLCGDNHSGSITDCYATGSVSGEDISTYLGGLCGYNFSDVTNCYATGRVTGGSDTYYLGGLCGESSGSITYSFWDAESSEVGSAGDDNYGATGKTTAQMQTQSTFTDWNFTVDWMMLREGEDYPRLAWQEIYTGDIAGLYGVDLIDFTYLSQYWGLDDCNGVDDCGRADTDGNGDVGIPDLVNVADDWMK